MRGTLITVFLLALAGCSPDQKGNEIEIQSYVSGVEFRILEIHRSYGVSNWKEFVVVCRSNATMSARAQPADFVPQGSVFVGRITNTELYSPQGGDDLTVATHVTQKSLGHGSGWMAWKHIVFRISLDHCATWVEFQPWKEIPYKEVLLSDARPCDSEKCAKLALDNARPLFRDIRVERRAGSSGDHIRFTLQSAALEDPGLREVASEDGGRTWRVTTPAEDVTPAAAWKPDANRYVIPAPSKPARAIPAQALTEDDLAKIPAPQLEGADSSGRYVIARIKNAAKAGSLSRVKEAKVNGYFPPPGSEVDQFRQAVLQAMAAKAADSGLSAKLSEPTPAPAPHALTDADLAKIPTPRSQDAGSFVPYLVEEIKKAARTGSVSGVMGVSVAGEPPPPGGEVDQFRQAVLRAMAAKAAEQGLSAQQSELKPGQRAP